MLLADATPPGCGAPQKAAIGADDGAHTGRSADDRTLNAVKDNSGSLMLAAGGTGGHLFPAYALAEEMARRGVAVDLVTDMRGDRYGTGFPARKVYQVPSATLGGKPARHHQDRDLALARRRRRLQAVGRRQAREPDRRLRRTTDVSAFACGPPARIPSALHGRTPFWSPSQCSPLA